MPSPWKRAFHNTTSGIQSERLAKLTEHFPKIIFQSPGGLAGCILYIIYLCYSIFLISFLYYNIYVGIKQWVVHNGTLSNVFTSTSLVLHGAILSPFFISPFLLLGWVAFNIIFTSIIFLDQWRVDTYTWSLLYSRVSSPDLFVLNIIQIFNAYVLLFTVPTLKF